MEAIVKRGLCAQIKEDELGREGKSIIKKYRTYKNLFLQTQTQISWSGTSFPSSWLVDFANSD